MPKRTILGGSFQFFRIGKMLVGNSFTKVHSKSSLNMIVKQCLIIAPLFAWTTIRPIFDHYERLTCPSVLCARYQTFIYSLLLR